MGETLRHPFGLALLLASLLLAGAVRFLPDLERWSGQAPWVLLLGVLAYAACALTCFRTQSSLSAETSGPNAGAPESEHDSHGRPSVDFLRLVEEALRHLNNPAALSRSGLLARLPGTLVANSVRRSGDEDANPGPLEQAQALRIVLVSAIDRLRPSDEAVRAGTPEALPYQILHEEYVLERSPQSIVARHSIGESTFYRNRRTAVSALALHLETLEAQTTQGPQPR